jgi:hypothetical protein
MLELTDNVTLYERVLGKFGDPSEDQALIQFHQSRCRPSGIPFFKIFLQFCITAVSSPSPRPILFAIHSFRTIFEKWGCLISIADLNGHLEFLTDATIAAPAQLLVAPAFGPVCETLAIICGYLMRDRRENHVTAIKTLKKLWERPIDDTKFVALQIIRELCVRIMKPLPQFTAIDNEENRDHLVANAGEILHIVAQPFATPDQEHLRESALEAFEELLLLITPRNDFSHDGRRRSRDITFPHSFSAIFRSSTIATFLLSSIGTELSDSALNCLNIIICAHPASWERIEYRASFLLELVESVGAVISRRLPVSDRLFSKFLFRLSTRLGS